MKIKPSSSKTNNLDLSRDKISSTMKRINSSSIINRSKSGIFKEVFPPENSVCSRILIKEKIIDNENPNRPNSLCGEYCPNKLLMKKYEQDIKDLIESNINLKKMNECLLKTITIKDNLFLDLKNENSNLIVDNNILNSHIGSKRIVSGRQCQIRKRFDNSFFPECHDQPSYYNNNNSNSNTHIFNNSNFISHHRKNSAILPDNSIKINNKKDLSNSNNTKSNLLGRNSSKVKNKKEFFINKEIKFIKTGKNSCFINYLNFSKEKNKVDQNNSNNSEFAFKKISEVMFRKVDNISQIKKTISRNSYAKTPNLDLRKNLDNNEIKIKNIKNDKLNNIEDTNLENLNKNSKSNIENQLSNYDSNPTPESTRKPSGILDQSTYKLNKGHKNSDFNKLQNIPDSNLIVNRKSIMASEKENNTHNNKNESNVINTTNQQKDFYERISIIGGLNNEKQNNFKNKSRPSLLGHSDESLSKILSSAMILNLKRITLNDEEFIEFFSKTPQEYLICYSDTIYQLISDLESAIKLIQRLRVYITATSTLINCTRVEEIVSSMIGVACKIMDCDRATIFTYDSISDMLVVHTAEGLNRNEFRVRKNMGIVGAAFMSGETIRVDNAYEDLRFSKDFDKKTNYFTKTILAAPLKDQTGKPFGIIQCINKNNGKFIDDDEELIFLFAMHVGHVMKSAKNNDENVSYIARLKLIIDSRELIEKINNLLDFTIIIEQLIMDVFSSHDSQILIYNENNSKFVKFSKYEKREKNKNIGIIGYVYEKKEFFGVVSSSGCAFYNKLVDIETGMSILTYPIICKGEVKAILQFAYNGKMIIQKNPEECDQEIIKYIIIDCVKWFNRNEDIVKNGLTQI